MNAPRPSEDIPTNVPQSDARQSDAQADENQRADEQAEPPASTGTATGAPDGEASTAQRPPTVGHTGQATFAVTTKPSPEQPFGPKHVLAIWVEDHDQTPIKLLGLWAGISARRLLVYTARVAPLLAPSPQAQHGIGRQPDPDTITSATQRSHETREVTWTLTDATGQLVADADYTIVVEVADNNDSSVLTSVSFTKGGEPATIELEETDAFGPVRLEYQPD